MNAREQRGLVIAAVCKLSRNGDGKWLVPSQTVEGRKYEVDPDQGKCTCPDCQETGFVCKHQFAVRFTVKRELDAGGNIVETKLFTFMEQKTYSQNWKAYNLAQHTEKHRFKILLNDLCQTVPEPPQARTGRPRIPIADRLFACCYKVYSTISSRRFACDLKDAHEQGYLSRPLHCNVINALLESADLTPALNGLIARSSLPLRAVESEFAVDSTGFSTSRHVRWHDEKYGCKRSGRDWVKVHVVCGVKTHVITAAAIYGREANDSPIMPELIKLRNELKK